METESLSKAIRCQAKKCWRLQHDWVTEQTCSAERRALLCSFEIRLRGQMLAKLITSPVMAQPSTKVRPMLTADTTLLDSCWISSTNLVLYFVWSLSVLRFLVEKPSSALMPCQIMNKLPSHRLCGQFWSRMTNEPNKYCNAEAEEEKYLEQKSRQRIMQ